MGRPITCECGQCPKCRHRENVRIYNKVNAAMRRARERNSFDDLNIYYSPQSSLNPQYLEHLQNGRKAKCGRVAPFPALS